MPLTEEQREMIMEVNMTANQKINNVLAALNHPLTVITMVDHLDPSEASHDPIGLINKSKTKAQVFAEDLATYLAGIPDFS